MVLPAQNITPNISEFPEVTNSPDASGAEGSPTTPEGISTIGSPQPKTNDNKKQKVSVTNTGDSDPKPGEIVDKASKHKEKITTISTTDPITLKADEEENEFIPLVEEAHDTDHE